MNAMLKRMFEDDDCSNAEANLKAAMLGKPYEECKKDWELQFKKEFVLAHSNLLVKYDYVADQAGKFNFVMAMWHYASLMDHKIMKCHGVSFDVVNVETLARHRQHAFHLTISFYDFELDNAFMLQVRKKLLKCTEP